MTEKSTNPLRVACLQLSGSADIQGNIAQATGLLEQAVQEGAQFVLTPEVSNFISGDNADIARLVCGEEETLFLSAFREAAAKHNLWVLIGSLLVRGQDETIYNRSFLLDNTGAIVARYDKIHLFEAHLAEDRVYREADWMSGGGEAVVADLPWARLGLTICYDLRFPHLHRALCAGGG